MIVTQAAYFIADPDVRPLLPYPFQTPDTAVLLGRSVWDLLVLNHTGCRTLLSQRTCCTCHTLLLPGEEVGAVTQLIKASQVISTGLSSRNSITFSSLQRSNTLICVQRTLMRSDGTLLEPQEFLLPNISLAPEEQLLLFGAQLLLR